MRVDPYPRPRPAVGSVGRRAALLGCPGDAVEHHAGGPPDTTDLVVLSDFLVTDPRVVRELHTARVAHLPVRLRDGAGLVGPLVIPGVTSCLGGH